MHGPEWKEIERRPQRYWNVDGLPEVVMGFLFILWGGLTLIGDALPRRPVYGIYWLVVPVVLATSGFWGNWAIKRLKERITYPRAGFVEMRGPRKMVAAAAAVIALGLAALIVSGGMVAIKQWIPPGCAVVMALGFLLMGVRYRMPDLLGLAAVSLGLGIWMYQTKAGFVQLNWTFVCLGAASLVLGTVRLRRFLRANPKAPEAGE